MYLDTVEPFAIARSQIYLFLHSTTPRATLLGFLRTISSSLNTLRFCLFFFLSPFIVGWLKAGCSNTISLPCLGEWRRKAGISGLWLGLWVRRESLWRPPLCPPGVFICVEEGDGCWGCHGRPHSGLFSASSYLALTESQSNTSLASCFLCFWMLGISTWKEHMNMPHGTSSRLFSLMSESVIFIYKCFFSLGKGFCTLHLRPLFPKKSVNVKSTDG